MRNALLAAVTLAALALGACGNAVANPAPPANPVALNPPDASVRSGLKTYLSQAEGMKVSENQIDQVMVQGDFARARLSPEEVGSAEPALYFLKREKGLWTVVLGPGTAFSTDDLKSAGVPETLAP